MLASVSTADCPQVPKGASLYCSGLTHSLRVCGTWITCGDWARVLTPSVTVRHGVTAVFLDPPYGADGVATGLYAQQEANVAAKVHAWCAEHGADPRLRIALCGYDGEHEMPKSWAVHSWSAGEGFGAQAEDRSENGKRERIWFSPGCRVAAQADLFAGANRAE